jgi:hypothetical protein
MKDTMVLGAPVGTSRVLDLVESASSSLVDNSAPAFPSPPAAPEQGLHKVFQLMKKPGSKLSVGSSIVPFSLAMDQSGTKPASAPAKVKAQAVPFNQYGSNLEEDKLFAEGPILQPEAISMMIVLNKDSAPDSDEPVDPQILKRSKLSAEVRAEVGWESPEDWEFNNETLAANIAKLKKKQDGEVDNPPASASKVDLTKEVTAAS